MAGILGFAEGLRCNVAMAFRRAAANRLGISLALSAVLFVCGWRTVAVITRPTHISHLDEIARELGSVAEFWNRPAPNHSGTRIVFQQSTATGVGVFLCDIATGHRELLYEQPEKDYEKNREQLVYCLWGWSPDDRFFIYSRRPGVNPSKHELVICDGVAGQAVAVVTAYSPYSRDLVWLSERAFAFVDSRKDLYRVELRKDQHWGRPVPFEQSGKHVPRNAEGLAALAPDTIAWRDGQAIWAWTYGVPEPVKLWEAPATNALIDLAVDPQEKNLLLHLRNLETESLVQLYWPTRVYTPLATVEAPESCTNRVVWFEKEAAALYVESGIQNNAIDIRTKGSADAVQITFDAGLNSLAGNESGLYIVGSRSGEAVGIWRYSARDGSLTCVVWNPGPAFRFARMVVPTRQTVTNDSGTIISYRLWSPPEGDNGNRRPLLIGKASGRWNSYPAVAAQSGAYFASIERDHKYGDWTEEALPLYEHLRKTLKIDAENLFPYGNSADTPFISLRFEMQHDVWRGMILFSPVTLPNLACVTPSHRLLIDYGEDDRNAGNIADFLNATAQAGITVMANRHENAEHVYRTTVSIRSRDLAVMNFVANNREPGK